MSAIKVQEKPVAPEAAQAIKDLDARIAESRKEAATGKAGTRELRILTWLVLGMLLPILLATAFLDQEIAKVVATYAAIIGLVCSAWGAWIGLGPRCRNAHGIGGTAYALLFVLLALLYGSALASGKLGKKPRSFDNSPLRKK